MRQRRLTISSMFAWPLVWAGSLPALGTPPDPSTDPILNDPAITDVIVDKQRRPAGEAPRPPQPPPPALESVPGVRAPRAESDGTTIDFSLADHRVYPEGTFIVGRVGAVVRARTGESIFVSAPPPAGSPDRRDAPMILLPCQRLSQLEASLETPGNQASTPRALTLSGQVFVYADRMYLLASAFAFPEPAKTTTPERPADAPKAGEGELAADDIIRELERLPGSTRLLGSQPTEGARPTDATALAARAQAAVLPEGTVLTNRRGRLVRSAIEGELSFSFDNDPDSPGMPAMPLLPCKLLRSLESLASLQGDALQFRVSGRVTTYHGRNFLLPTWYQAVRQPGLRSRQ